MEKAYCRCCMLPLSEESIKAGRCVSCGAYINRFIALAMQEVRERETVEPDAWWRDEHPAMPDVDGRREAYYQAGLYPPKPII